MFVMTSDPRFTHPVTVNVPIDGGHEVQTFKATFRVIGVTKAATYDFSDGASSSAFLKEVFVGFDDVAGVDGQPVPFSDKARDSLTEMPFVRAPLVKAYFAGVTKAELGN